MQYTNSVRHAWRRCLGMDIEDFSRLSPTGFCRVYEQLGAGDRLGRHEFPEQEVGNYTTNEYDPDAYDDACAVAAEMAEQSRLPGGIDAREVRVIFREYVIVCDRFFKLLRALCGCNQLQRTVVVQMTSTRLDDDAPTSIPDQRPTSFEVTTGVTGYAASLAREFLGIHEQPARQVFSVLHELFRKLKAAEDGSVRRGLVGTLTTGLQAVRQARRELASLPRQETEPHGSPWGCQGLCVRPSSVPQVFLRLRM